MLGEFYKNKNILVTGHTGFKGAWLVQTLLQMGGKVSGYAIDVPTQPSLFGTLDLAARISHRTGDVRDFRCLAEFCEEVRPDIVFHLAAQSLVGVSYREPFETFETNVMGTIQVLEVIRTVKSVKAAVIVTTDKCYRNSGDQKSFVENDPLGGEDPYGASKACAEIATRSYMSSFFKEAVECGIATARAGNVIGGGDWAFDRIVPDCVRAWSANNSIAIRSPTSTRPWQHVLEPIYGYLLLARQLLTRRDSCHGEGFNFGPDSLSAKTVLELVRKMTETWDNTSWHIEEKDAYSGKEAEYLSLVSDKAKSCLGWQPSLGFEEMSRMTVSWYKQYYLADKEVSEITNQQIDKFFSTR